MDVLINIPMYALIFVTFLGRIGNAHKVVYIPESSVDKFEFETAQSAAFISRTLSYLIFPVGIAKSDVTQFLNPTKGVNSETAIFSCK